MAKNITSRSEDYSKWYLDVIRAAELADYAPVRGCMVIRPTGYAIWENIQKHFDERFKEMGHVNAYFPLLIPTSFLEKEAQHVEGFAPECAVVTHAGGEELEEPLLIRPTSETIIGHMYSKWVQSWRDLPILINQWCNIMRWEKRSRLFLRTSEFLWQEGHTAHATGEEAMQETLDILNNAYMRIMQDVLALPVLAGEKTAGERFPGADNTFSCETMMSDTKALQAGTSHYMGQNFAKAFEIKYQSKDGSEQFAWTTSWGVSTRLVGALVMTHSDDDGLILPPNIAPIKVVILPISTKEDVLADSLEPQATELKAKLEKALGRHTVAIDKQYHNRPGDRFFYHLQRGVPLRIELGEKELESRTLQVVRRDTGEKITLSFDALDKIPALLDEIQANLYDNALKFRLANTHKAENFEQFKEIIASKGGFIETYFAGTKEDERDIKAATAATARCMPVDDDSTGKCFYTGRAGARKTIFAKAY